VAGMGTAVETGTGIKARDGVGADTEAGVEVVGIETGVGAEVTVGVVTKEEAGACGEVCVILGREDMVCGRDSAPPDALRASASEAKVFISY